MARVKYIYINSTHRVEFKSVKNVDGAFVNDGTATFQLKDKETDEVLASGTLSYQAASDAVYRGSISHTITTVLIPRNHYILAVVFTGPGGDVTEDHEEYEARYQ